MRETGILDSNGEMIYEGDRVKGQGEWLIGTIVWWDRGFWMIDLDNDPSVPELDDHWCFLACSLVTRITPVTSDALGAYDIEVIAESDRAATKLGR